MTRAKFQRKVNIATSIKTKHHMNKIIKRISMLSAAFALSLNALPVIADDKTQWRTPSMENLAVMTLPQGKVVFELTPEYAPKHVKHFTSLLKSGHYQGNPFYRVIDGFVAQAGPAGGEEESAKKEPMLAIESEWATDKDWSFTLVQDNDLFAEQTGLKNGFAIGQSRQDKKAWLTHCPGVLAMARGNEPDTATSHFYITNGQAPRYLDRIMTVFGRVVFGMEHVQAIQRTSVIEGQAPIDESLFTKIVDFKLMSDLPENQRIHLQIEDTESSAFKAKLDDRRTRPHAFFYKKPPPVLDVCQVPVRSRLITN